MKKTLLKKDEFIEMAAVKNGYVMPITGRSLCIDGKASEWVKTEFDLYFKGQKWVGKVTHVDISWSSDAEQPSEINKLMYDLSVDQADNMAEFGKDLDYFEKFLNSEVVK